LELGRGPKFADPVAPTGEANMVREEIVTAARRQAWRVKAIKPLALQPVRPGDPTRLIEKSAANFRALQPKCRLEVSTVSRETGNLLQIGNRIQVVRTLFCPKPSVEITANRKMPGVARQRFPQVDKHVLM